MPNSDSRSLLRAACYALIAVSGFTVLGYEIAWSRMFGFGLGHELPGTLAVVAAFFFGFALGAWTLDRPISQSERPGRWYAILELLMGAWGLGTMALLPLVNEAAQHWIGLDASRVQQWAVAFLVPLITLLPATMAMGASLPAMERFVTASSSKGRYIGGLYAASTFGALAGVVGSTFWILPELGFSKTLLTLAVMNVAGGLIMLAVERGRSFASSLVAGGADAPPAITKSGAQTSPSSPGPGRVLDEQRTPKAGNANWRFALIIFASGLLGIGYEIVGLRVLSELLENTIYSFAAVLSVYLLGIALGAAFYQRFGARWNLGSSLEWLLLGLMMASLAGAWTLSWVPNFYEFLRGNLGDSVLGVMWAEMLAASVVFGLPTCVMGCVFSALVQATRRPDGGVGRALAINTLGSALAPGVFGVVLLPSLGIKGAFLSVGIGYLGLFALALRHESTSQHKGSASPGTKPRPLKQKRAVSLGVRTWQANPRIKLILGLCALAAAPFILPARMELIEKPPGGEILEYRQGLLGSVAVVRHFDGHRSLLVNNRFVMGGTGAAAAAQRHAHIPLLLHPNPGSALFLGLGTSITFSAAGAHPDLVADGVELLEEVLKVRNHFEPENRLRSGLKEYVADARRFVRAATTAYDVIVADLFHPARDGAGALYTAEHFQAIHRRLAPGGLFCQWLPLYQLDEAMLKVITKTFLTVFPHSRAFLLRFNVDTPVLGLIAQLEPARYSPSWFETRVQDGALKEALRPLSLVDNFQLFGSYLADAEALARYSEEARLNTDDHPIVMFEAPRFTHRRQEPPYGRLTALLDKLSADPQKLIEASGTHAAAAFQERLARFAGARNLYLKGLAQESAGHGGRATTAYLESVARSSDFTTAYAHCLSLAVGQFRSNPDEARRLLERLQELQPSRPAATELLNRLFPASPREGSK